MQTRAASLLKLGILSLSLAGLVPAAAAPDATGLLFRLSADKDLVADVATGDAQPNFLSGVTITPDGAIGSAVRWPDDGYVAWKAPGNMAAQRGTLSFFWRARQPVGETPFVLFRTGFADHTSWDMAFLRIDWNGHGFDAFVTDANLSRVRVSWTIPTPPTPEAWHHLAFAWDETVGVRLFWDGKLVASKLQKADLDSGLDQFGLAARIMSPHQVQSRYSFMRGSDFDEIRVYDHMLATGDVAALAAKGDPAPASALSDSAARQLAWLHRYGWDKASPPVLADPVTRVRKVEFADAKDLKAWMWKGVDGIPETTWPGVYNRSRLPGRDDYFELPDWNTYVEGGKTYDLTLPTGEAFNRVEIRGAAYGDLAWSADGTRYASLAKRPQGVVRSVMDLTERTGGKLRFTNVMQEQPIQEIWAYDIGAGKEPEGTFKLSYKIDASAAPDLAVLTDLNAFIASRYAPDERSTLLAMPIGGARAAVGAGDAAAAGAAVRPKGLAPIVHILIPAGFGEAPPGRPFARAWAYGWQNIHDGLDGIAIDIPALKLKPRPDGLIPLNIKVKDPIWPGRDMIDLSVSVRPNEKRTLWLDLRDRILSNDSLYLTMASAAPDFDAQALDGAAIRLVFKDRAAALEEHVADRLNQVKDNWAFLVEEHTTSKRAGLYQRLYADTTDLLRVDPDNLEGRAYWADINYTPANLPPVTLPAIPAGVPAWAARQLQDLAATRRFVDWWIDERQVPYGDFGGGISDDDDLTGQWPGLALMGVQPDKINASLRALTEASYRNGMHTNGLGTIETDELHTYEEGLNADAERLYLNWGEPVALERLMATARALHRVALVNPAGHLHLASSWYGGRQIHRDDPWSWQKPYGFLILHAPTLLGLYNGNPDARGLVTGLMDGWIAHGKQAADGIWSFPNEINFYSDKERVGDGGGATTVLQPAWAAYRFTGDAKYLRPILGRVAKAGPSALAEFNENSFDVLPEGPAWRKALAGKAGTDSFSRYAAWAQTGDLAPLAALHTDSLRDKMQHEAMLTTGHWWSDRVDSPSDILQRERLGGVALRRGLFWPGNTVSWRFADSAAAEQVAILVPGATPDRFRVIAYNTSAVPQRATMTGWSVTAGRWTMKAATSIDEGKTLASSAPDTQVTLERGAGVEVSFAPNTTTVLDFALATPTTPAADRADLGIGTDDVVRRGRAVAVTVHSLGAHDAVGGTAELVGADGSVLATATVPTLAAPLDLTPKTAAIRLTLPAGIAPTSVRVRLRLPNNAPEVTYLNNEIPLR
ncbi:LamG-like jellyroll fold domain-containing protein [Sphingomonas sp. BIUV-7]|uniref:LamG-like jellyroll fold domain-containing protein n=1 Tax=Sphingomonas natans TaxID=3063330 RepID=A0ABT8Y6Q0_9SPHN|nr:LamG-like jellyroll fold domain-containing protein [Sphingomonas sp. BIUV-7]MDO6413355.1 LamG-like jellyroll fold domain-containing protein [Sphingomonas sp. BIUV-7]